MRDFQEPKMVTGNVSFILIKMAFPMFFGILSVILFNLVDSYYIGMLGYQELSAITYTFPVTFAIMTFTVGIGVGTSSLVAKSIGQENMEEAQKTVTHSLLLGFFLVLFISTIGYLTIEPLFLFLGAKKEQLTHISSYMKIWYLAVGLVVIPIIGNASIRATGDSLTPSLIMSSSALLNFILDPIFIFGGWGITPLGMKGAAVATAISYSVTFFGSLLILYHKKKLLNLNFIEWKLFKQFSLKILQRSLPICLTNMLIPLTNAYLTRLASKIGPESVAAFGICSRLEAVSLVGVIAISMILNPFVGQNLGANQIDRIKNGMNSSYFFAIIWSAIAILISLIFAESIAGAFSSNSIIISEIIKFCWIVPFSYLFLGISDLCSSGLIGLGKPKTASFININRLVLLTLPIAYISFHSWGLVGIFLSKSIANTLSGILGVILIQGQLRSNSSKS